MMGGNTVKLSAIAFPKLLFLVACCWLMACQSKKDSNSISLENDTWLFRSDSGDVGLKESWYQNSTNRSDWHMVHSGVWPDDDGLPYNGVAWYASSFQVHDSAEQLVLLFGGLGDTADVWIDGAYLGNTTINDEPVSLTLPDLTRGQHETVVRVVARTDRHGIYKPVHVISVNGMKKFLTSKLSAQSARTSPQWVHDAVIYEVYLRSFSKTGSFKSLEKRLLDLKSLGVTIIWLMPIHPVGELGRKGLLGSPYAVQDYYAVNPEFGTLDDFKALVAAVHKLGLKIIIDLVANHTAWDSQLMFDHPEWFKKNKRGEIVSPNSDWTDVAQLDYQNHELRKYMINMMTYWVRDIGIDGFRCDVADLVPLDFWETARGRLDEIKPVIMLAEGDNPEDHLKAFDLTYSWNMYDVLADVVHDKRSVSILDKRLERETMVYPGNSLRLRFISNHDKNVQDDPAIRRYGQGGSKAVAAWLCTFPGVPLLYDGDEAGNPKTLSLTDKVDIDWTKGAGLRRLYEGLLSVRKKHEALRSGMYRRLWCSDSTHVYAFERQAGTDVVDVAINFSGKPLRVYLKGDGLQYKHVLGDLHNVKDGRIEVLLGSYGFSVFAPAGKESAK